MENTAKQSIKLKLGLTLQQIIASNKVLARAGKESGKKDHLHVTSLRKLAASAGIEFAIIQKISSGKKNAEITTLVGIADGLGMSMADFFAHFDKVTDADILLEKERVKATKSTPKKK
jgi:hypothetical protein